jgi:hypothetical protein
MTIQTNDTETEGREETEKGREIIISVKDLKTYYPI